MIRSIGKMMMWVGAVGCGAALVWWLSFFHQMLGDDVKRASECFYRTTMECEVGNLIGGFMDVPPYDPVLLWWTGGLLVAGALVYALAPR
jgi:hypothetical protein